MTLYSSINLNSTGGVRTLTADSTVASGGKTAVYTYGAVVGRFTNFGVVEAQGTITIDPMTGMSTVTGNPNSSVVGMGVSLAAGGTVQNGSNGASALISGGSDGIYIVGAAGTVSNYGTIKATGNPMTSIGYGINLRAGGTIVNANSGAAISGTKEGVYITGASGSIINRGVITATNAISGCGIYLDSGAILTNQAGATISGAKAGIYVNSAVTNPITVTNAGAITSSGGIAIQLGSGNDHVIVAPGAVFSGKVIGGAGTNTIELASAASSGTLTDLGGQFVQFGSVVVDSGGSWALAETAGLAATDVGAQEAIAIGNGARLEIQQVTGQSTVDNKTTITFTASSGTLVLDAASQFAGAVTNFAAGDTLDLIHVAATASNYSGGILTLTNNGAVTASIAVSTPYSAPAFSVGSDGAGGTLVGVTGTSSTPPSSMQVATLDTMQPGDFANRGVDDTIWMGTDGSVRIYEVTNGQVTAAPLVSQVGTDWSFAAVGHCFGAGAASDYLLQRNDGTIELYQVQNDQVIGAGRMAVVGSDWRAVATGDFYQVGSDSLLIYRPSDGAYELYDIRGGQVAGASQLAKIGTDWTFAGTGNFYNNGTLDFLAEQQGTGALEVWQVQNGQIIGANQIGVVGGDEHVVAVADFNNDGVSDILMESNSGTFRIYEFQNGQVVAAPVVAQIGTNWQPAGVGNFFGDGNDFLMRSGPTVELYHVQDYQVTGASTLASVGSNIQIAGGYFNHPV